MEREITFDFYIFVNLKANFTKTYGVNQIFAVVPWKKAKAENLVLLSL
jgi:hypothetical protein